jgi:peptidoglycan lytic transglycosylase
MPGPFQSRVATRFIAILCLAGLCAKGAMAQSAPQVLVATLGPTDMVAEPTPVATSVESSGLAVSSAGLETRLPKYFETFFGCCENSSSNSSAISNIPLSSPIPIRLASGQLYMSSNTIATIRRSHIDVLLNFIAAYNSLSKSLPVRAKSLIQKYAALMRDAVVGVASTYNPYREKKSSQEKQTASGEPYDPTAWTAAIRIDMREQFGGVRFGKNYLPTFALVESDEKYVIVKINDVGPLKPGRLIDLNERSMRYFDPTQQLGLINGVKVIPLPGEDWTPGPIAANDR